MPEDRRAIGHVLRFWFVLIAIATVAVGAAALRRARASAAAATVELPTLGHVPSFSMPDQLGHTVTDETLRGQVLVVDFFYASCTTSCPLLTTKMHAIQGALASRERELGRPLPVHLVSITLDPENDTPAALEAYAKSVGADEARWSFLSGRSADLDRVVVQGFKVSFQRPDPGAGIAAIMHGEWLVLVDPNGALRGFYSAGDPERMQAVVTDAVQLSQLAGPATYHATGVIQSFGPNRDFVNIAHRDIPGYIKAMTMSFESQRHEMLGGLSPNDRVSFDFIETSDARRVLTRIDKQP